MIDHRAHISPGLRFVLFPIRLRLVHVKDRLITPETHMIEQRRPHPKQPLQRCLMIASHGDDTIRPVEQGLRKLPLDITGRIRATFPEQRAHQRMDGLWFGLDPGGTDDIPAVRPQMLLERVLRREAPKNVACADKKNRPC